MNRDFAEVRSMEDDVCSFALKNTLDEIQKICPDIRNVFVFREDGEIVARDENTAEETIVHAIDALDGILEKGDVTDGLENIVFEGNKGRLNVSHVDELYLVTVTSKGADANYVNTVTRVLVSTVAKLLEKISSAPVKTNSDNIQIEPEDSPIKHTVEQLEDLAEETEAPEQEERVESEAEHEDKPESKREPIVSEAPANQFIVEDIGGLLVAGDTVRIDNDILLQWSRMYEDREIEEVEIETFEGKSIRCRLRAIKDAKYEGKGIIQMPEKIQNALGIRKGELVRVRPVIE